MATEKSQTEATASNFIMPIILFLVSVIVITATFYEEEYKKLFTWQNTTVATSENTTATAKTNIQSEFLPAQITSKHTDNLQTVNLKDNEQPNETIARISAEVAENTAAVEALEKQPEVTENTEQTVTTSTTALAKNVALEIFEVNTATQDAVNTESVTATSPEQIGQQIVISPATQTVVTTPKKNENKNAALANKPILLKNQTTQDIAPSNHVSSNHATPVYPTSYFKTNFPGENFTSPNQAPNQASQQVYNQQRQNYFDAMQQNYQKQMQIRHQRFLTEIKAQQERRNKVIAAKKAIYLQEQQNRYEADKKIQQIKSKISQLNDEIRQLKLNPNVIQSDLPEAPPSTPTSKQM